MARTMGRKALSSNSPRLVNRNERAGPGLGTDLLFKKPEDRLARKLPTRLPSCGRSPVSLQLGPNRSPVDRDDPMIFHSGNRILADCHLVRSGGIDNAVQVVTASTACMAAKARHMSIVTPAMIGSCDPSSQLRPRKFPTEKQPQKLLRQSIPFGIFCKRSGVFC